MNSMIQRCKEIHIQNEEIIFNNHCNEKYWYSNQSQIMGSSHLDVQDIEPIQKYHKHSYLPLERIKIYFKQINRRKICSQTIFLDLVSEVETLGQFFRPDIFGMEKSYMTTAWSKGHYTRGAEFIDQVMIVVRQKAEGCDC
ncbi:unnamed protein product [Paramecium sonneborni]|uniref:Uncharacterized protein n=1 Tax=Paramecium sonneborni TaxID=65129 RepID=A0A8S1RJ58_9CILI|nr:unnamed protein product [Paramecium sonneborni]